MRGCVRVTGVGVEAVVEGCHYLEVFDVSQCKNLTGWLEAGGVQRVGGYVAGMNGVIGSVSGKGGSRMGSAGSDMMSIGSTPAIGGEKWDSMGLEENRDMVNGQTDGDAGAGKRKIKFEVVADGRWRSGKY